eukprot:6191715-Pleurochrysis_carterae.AAC.3
MSSNVTIDRGIAPRLRLCRRSGAGFRPPGFQRVKLRGALCACGHGSLGKALPLQGKEGLSNSVCYNGVALYYSLLAVLRGASSILCSSHTDVAFCFVILMFKQLKLCDA